MGQWGTGKYEKFIKLKDSLDLCEKFVTTGQANQSTNLIPSQKMEEAIHFKFIYFFPIKDYLCEFGLDYCDNLG